MVGQFSFGGNQESCKRATIFLPKENHPVILLYPDQTHPLIPAIKFCHVLAKHPWPLLIIIFRDPHKGYGYSMKMNWHMLWIIPSL
jgi:hypothetical protein